MDNFEFIKYGLIALVVSLVLGAIQKTSKKAVPAQTDGEQTVFDFHPAIAVLGWITVVLFTGIAVASNIWNNGTANWITTLLFLGFAALGSLLIFWQHSERYSITEEGLVFQTLGKKSRLIPWESITLLRYNVNLTWIRLESEGNKPVHLQVMVRGFVTLGKELRRRCPTAIKDAATGKFLLG